MSTERQNVLGAPSAHRAQRAHIAETAKAPRPVRASFVLWLVAVSAGVFETILAVTAREAGGDVLVGVAVRLAVFAAAIFLAVRLLRGRNWARIALAIFLSGLGMLSLVVGPIQWLLDGNSLSQAVAAADAATMLFASSRILHVAAVIAATVLMFTPAANAYLRSGK